MEMASQSTLTVSPPCFPCRRLICRILMLKESAGTPAKPIISNALDIPLKKLWLKYMELGKQFDSNIIHLSAMNTHIVIHQTIEDITELLERRSAK